ncbi:phage tail protein I [Lentzea sp. NPDC059081]|uniref:phage tail protein I n=1 Tax=Lentzea sp. NPDC059081 TaxID=3346719 RepID=UPI00367C8439
MRGVVEELPSPHPLVTLLPAVYQEDEFTVRFTGGLDAVLAPVLTVLDCLTAYVDPLLAPSDFLEWLSGWVGVEPDEDWPDLRRRTAIAAAVALHSSRGTVAGLRTHLEIVSGGQVVVTESGGVRTSATPTTEVPDVSTWLHVRVVARSASAGTLDAVVTAAKPVHVPHELEVVSDDRLS